MAAHRIEGTEHRHELIVLHEWLMAALFAPTDASTADDGLKFRLETR